MQGKWCDGTNGAIGGRVSNLAISPIRFLFAQVGRVETDHLYRFFQGAPGRIKTVAAVAKQADKKRKRGE
jgi:hypothetical protein